MQTPFISSKGTLKGVFALSVMGVCGAMLWQQIADIPRADLVATFHAIGLWQWVLACLATLCSFLAVGRYDAVWHQRLGTGISDRKARHTGMAAIAIGQTIGAGTITGAFVRWHLLPQLGFKTTTGITIGVSLSFLTCWAVFGAMAAMWLGLVPVMPVLWGARRLRHHSALHRRTVCDQNPDLQPRCGPSAETVCNRHGIRWRGTVGLGP